jgi:hypothetical protein
LVVAPVVVIAGATSAVLLAAAVLFGTGATVAAVGVAVTGKKLLVGCNAASEAASAFRMDSRDEVAEEASTGMDVAVDTTWTPPVSSSSTAAILLVVAPVPLPGLDGKSMLVGFVVESGVGPVDVAVAVDTMALELLPCCPSNGDVGIVTFVDIVVVAASLAIIGAITKAGGGKVETVVAAMVGAAELAIDVDVCCCTTLFVMVIRRLGMGGRNGML